MSFVHATYLHCYILFKSSSRLIPDPQLAIEIVSVIFKILKRMLEDFKKSRDRCLLGIHNKMCP